LKPVAELDGSGNLVSEFVYGAKSNVPDYVVRGGATYRVISDQLGSPRYVVNVVNSADVPFTGSYASFGVVTGTGLDWMPVGFAGGQFDGDSGLIRYGRRDMDPAIGRWLSKEPRRFHAARNFYAYALNDPVNLIDPTGLDPTGAGGASGEGGSEGAGNDPIPSDDPGFDTFTQPDPCYNGCMQDMWADKAGEVALMCLPFAPTPKTPWEYGKTLGGGSPLTSWLSRASMGTGASNAVRTFGAYAAKATAVPFAAGSSYWATAALLCSAECSE
jgi:RHS repeat-associated protein